MTPFYKSPITLKAVGTAVAIPLMLVGVPLLGWQAWQARPLNLAREFDVSTSTVPTPNAHDLYKQAHDEFQANMNWRDLPSAILEGPTSREKNRYPLAGKVRWVARNQRGFELFERGLKAEYLFPPIRKGTSSGYIEAPYDLLWLARLVTVEAEALAEQQRHQASANRALDIWQMGTQTSHGAPLTIALQSLIIENYGRHALDGEIAHLNGAQAAQAAKRLQKLLALRAPYKAILREERAAQLFQWKRGLEVAIWQKQRERDFEAALERDGELPPYDSRPAPEVNSVVINYQVRRTARKAANGTDILIANADAPWSKRAVTLPPAMEPATAKMVTKLGESRFFHAKAEAFAQLTLARLALHAHRKENGVYPASLSELSPKYLSATPTDAFADGAPLRYKRSGTGYKLWSIGPDARDDNARPMLYAKSKSPESKYLVSSEAEGDIVANINR